MGLHTTHNCWHGSFSSFHRWRRAVAKAAKLPDLDTMEGFGGTIAWSSLEPSPLLVLLEHSDCDGHINHRYCAPIADALEAVQPNMPVIWQTQTQAFIQGLRMAAKLRENVEFE